MKLFVLIAFALLVSSASAGLFRKRAKVLDIHISKGIPAIPVQPGSEAPVFVGQAPFVDYLPQGPLAGGFFVPVNHVQVGQVKVGQVPVHKAPVGKVHGSHGSLSLPVLSQHSVKLVPVHVNTPYLHPQLVSVEPSVQPVQLLFKSASSPLLVKQKHFSSPGAVYETTQSHDSPHVLRHVAFKPVVQEVRQIVQPYRFISTQIKPVHEQVQTFLPVQKGQFHGYQGQQGHEQFGQQHPQQQVHFSSEHFRPNSPVENFRFQQPGVKQPPPISQEPISQEPIEQEPIEQEPEQHPVKTTARFSA